MIRENRRKAESARPQVVGVIASAADFAAARKIRTPPDLFELRLDAFAPRIDDLDPALAELAAPLIITARDPAEGGLGGLSGGDRRVLLRKFIDRADYIDVELRSVRWSAELLKKARRSIISMHDFRDTPPLPVLRRRLQSAQGCGGDIFKIATRVDTAAQVDRLLAFFDESINVMPTAAMGVGRLGRRSREELARRGSVLNYGYLAKPQTAGQLSISELRRLVGRRA